MLFLGQGLPWHLLVYALYGILFICSAIWVALIMKFLLTLVDAYSPNPLWPYGVLPLLQPRQRFPQSCPFPSAQRLPLEKTVRLPVPLSIISGAWLTDGEIIRSSDSSRHLNHCQPHICLARPFAFLGTMILGKYFAGTLFVNNERSESPPASITFCPPTHPHFPPLPKLFRKHCSAKKYADPRKYIQIMLSTHIGFYVLLKFKAILLEVGP